MTLALVAPLPTVRTLHIGGVELWLRQATEDDRARVTRDWIMSYAGRTRCDNVTYNREQRRVVERLYPHVSVLGRGGSEVHAWVCAEPGLVHYVYVPAELRRLGFAKALVRAVAGERGEHTHRRPSGLSGFGGFTFNPYRIGLIE